jgi:TrmH family RNA methyltransferase
MDGVDREDARQGIVFVLDHPRDLANIGAVVRLMGNFGLAHLRLIDAPDFADEGLLRYARRGAPMLGRIERTTDLHTALADCGLVLGTTRRPRTVTRPVLAPRQAARALVAASIAPRGRGRAAVLFGSEDFGLANASLDRCQAIVTIPTTDEDASLNLAQAAAIMAYEIFLAATETPEHPIPPGVRLGSTTGTPAAQADLERLFASCGHLLNALYDPPINGRTVATMARLRALALRAAPTEREARLLTTVFEHAAREVAGRPCRA